MTNAIQGGVNDNSLRKAAETKSFQNLRMRVYSTQSDLNDFKIDSIYWKIFSFPGNDTGMYF